MATNKTPISVGVVDLPDHERVILKLIFAVSHKSTIRNFAYSIVDPATADIVLRDADSRAPTHDRVVLSVTDAKPETADGPVMLRPLIATRVLAVLDDYFAQQQRARREQDDANAADADADADTQETNSTEAPMLYDVAIVPEDAAINSADTHVDADPAHAVARDMAALDDALLRDDIIMTPTHVVDASRASRKRVLVVDDSPAVRKQIEIELVHFDVEVEFAASARQAIAMIDTRAYDLAFLDVVLPDMDGYQICKQVKAKAKRTKVIMITGKATTEDKLKGTLAGCDAYLVKPVGRLTFQSTVKSYLPLSAGARALKL